MGILAVDVQRALTLQLKMALAIDGSLLCQRFCRSGAVGNGGDLGTGKTVFAQGFAAGVGVTDTVNSPTFTIVQVYEEGRIPFYHFDVYRIGDSEEMFEIGYDEYVSGDGVCLIEWADMIEDILPKTYIKVMIDKDLSQGSDYRRIITERIG